MIKNTPWWLPGSCWILYIKKTNPNSSSFISEKKIRLPQMNGQVFWCLAFEGLFRKCVCINTCTICKIHVISAQCIATVSFLYSCPWLNKKSAKNSVICIIYGSPQNDQHFCFGSPHSEPPHSLDPPKQYLELRSRSLVSKKSPTVGPTERTPKPEYLIPLATYLGVRWWGPIQNVDG